MKTALDIILAVGIVYIGITAYFAGYYAGKADGLRLAREIRGRRP